MTDLAHPVGASDGGNAAGGLEELHQPLEGVGLVAKRIHAYLAWRNANAKHTDVLAAQRNERARIRSERQRGWGRPATRAA